MFRVCYSQFGMDYLTVSQAAEEEGVTTRYIVAEIERGNIKASKLDPNKATSPYIIPRKEFDSWQKRRRAQAEEA